ncbi:MAG: hypothetical protein OHK005_03180 [Candidatus Methylacidiphilales bacterium]
MADFFIVHRDPGFIARVKSALIDSSGHKVLGSCDSGQEALFLLGSTKVNVVLVQLALGDMDGLKLISQLGAKYPDICLVPVLEGTEGGDVWQKILQLNLRTVINGPADVATLVPLLKQAAQTAAELAARAPEEVIHRGDSYLITVAGARSGLGKTTFATNLAICLRAFEANVTLIDLSMNPGDFFTFLDQVPRNTLLDAIRTKDQLDPAYLQNLLSEHRSGLKFLACPNQNFDPNDLYGYTVEDAVALLKTARATADYIVVDTGAHDLPPTIGAIEEADVTFLITNRDLARLMALQRFLKYLRGERGIVAEKFKVVVNNAEVGTEVSDSEIESVLEHPITAYLPSIPTQTTFSINSGAPLAESKPELPFCAVIAKLAEISMNRWLDDAE